jgi:hypothetical protein
VLASIGTKAPDWLWACEAGAQGTALRAAWLPSLAGVQHDLERPA